MNNGKKFEQQFKVSLSEQKFFILRLPDPPQSFGRDSKVIRFSNKNPYDFLVFKNNKLYCLELKSTASTSFSIQFDEREKGKDIKLHQLKGLYEASSHKGIKAGFIFNFRKRNKTYFLSILQFNKFISIADKKSINENDVLNYGGILIPQKLKRVNYVYDFDSVIMELGTLDDFLDEKEI